MKIELLPGFHPQVDAPLADLLKSLTGKWYLMTSNNRTALIFNPKGDDSFVLGLPLNRRRSVSLSHLAWWRATNEWPDNKQGHLYHKNGDTMDFRFENLEARPPEARFQKLLETVKPPQSDKGISELPNGQFKVRAYDPATKKAKYVGLRNTREEAIELKRQFIAGEVGFKSPDKGFAW